MQCPHCGFPEPDVWHFRENPECGLAAGKIASLYSNSRRGEGNRPGRPPVWKTCEKCGASGLTTREYLAHVCGPAAERRKRLSERAVRRARRREELTVPSS